MKKEQLLRTYKKLMKQATIFSVYNSKESAQLQKQASLVLDQIEQLD
jgi:hypothetical protein